MPVLRPFLFFASIVVNARLTVLHVILRLSGLGHIGRSFRNEISPGNFLFRMREFEQMELEYFCAPAESDTHYKHWVQFCHDWLLRYGIRPDLVRLTEHAKADLAHYARACTDIEFRFSHGWGELWGIANRYVCLCSAVALAWACLSDVYYAYVCM